MIIDDVFNKIDKLLNTNALLSSYLHFLNKKKIL